jgi:hypothetical protein
MKKIYFIILVPGFLLFHGISFAQCSVSISTDPNTTQLDCNNPSITLSANHVASDSIKYSWNTGATTRLITVKDSGTYKVTIKDGKCTTSDSLHITKDIATPTVSIRAFPDKVCRGDSSTLIAIGADTYLWQPGSSTDTIISVVPTATTSYTVIGAAANGCKDTSTFRLVVNPLPGASISATNSTGCQYDTVTEPRITFTGSSGNQPYTFAYNFNSGPTQTITTKESNTVTIGVPTVQTGRFIYQMLSVTDSNGCTYPRGDSAVVNIGSAVVNILPMPNLISTKDTSVCNNTPFTYTAKSSESGTSFKWTRAQVAGITNNPASDSSALIQETLHNNTSLPVLVTYRFTLTTGESCSTFDSIKVTVNPTPVIESIADLTFCNGYNVKGIAFSSPSPDASFTWTSNTTVGFGTSGRDSIPSFTATNTGTTIIIDKVTVSVAANDGKCPGADSSFTITVNPTPNLVSTKDISLCSDSVFHYTAMSSAEKTSFTWTRAPVAGITNKAKSGSTAEIRDTLHNNTSLPVVVTYRFTLTTGESCSTTDSIKVTVNPTPVINPIADLTFCNGYNVKGIAFSSPSPDASFTWTSNTTVGFGTSGRDSIPSFTATNTGTTPIIDTVTVSIATNDGKCPGAHSSFTITVKPTPNLISTKDTSVCNNTPFTYTAKSSDSTTSFTWTRAQVDGVINDSASGSTAEIRETLHDTSSRPVVVSYIFTLSPDKNSASCDKSEIVKVTVYPTPKIDSIHSLTFCNGYNVNGIKFSSPTSDSSFTWTSSTTVGFGTSGKDSIPSFTATNTDTTAIIDKVTVSVTVNGGKCPVPDSTVFTVFTITVNPTPNLISTKDTSICNNTPFTYTAKSSAQGTSFMWTRDSVIAGITYEPKSGSTAVIQDTLHNSTTDTIVVKYRFELNTGDNSCIAKDSLMVTVYPTPKIDSIHSLTLCNGTPVSGIKFSSSSPDSSFTWTSSTTVGFSTSGKDSIPSFTATNTDTTAIIDKVTVSIAVNDGKCPGPDASFTIIVNPSPLRPSFTSLSGTSDNEILKLCSLSENINFNITSPQSTGNGIHYKWTSTPKSREVIIKDSIHPNTVITFNNPQADKITVTVTAKDNKNECIDSASQVVEITDKDIISPLKIFKKQPGNLLIYPDNSLSKYQWGYDTVVSSIPNTATSKPITVQGQVYQFYIPDTSCYCINNGSLNEDHFYYWILLHKDDDNGGCDTKIYYNGPYDDRPDIVRPFNPDNSIHLQVIPNPNKGIFEVSLKGNMYGNIEAQVYNSSGQFVSRKKFVKTVPEVNEKFITNGLPAGVYFLLLRSSDLKQVNSRFIISQ